MDPTSTPNYMTKYETYIFDADGVLWRGNTVIDGVPEVVNTLIETGKRVIILTNNSTKKLSDYVQKLNDMGYSKVKSENVVSSAVVCGNYLAKMKITQPVYLIGSSALKSTLEDDYKIKTFGFGPDSVTNYSNEMTLPEVEIRSDVAAVVVSFDPHFSYPKLFQAVNYLKNPKVAFIATNEDLTFPGQNPAHIYPGSGAYSTVLKAVTGRDAHVMGKPSKIMYNYIENRFNIDKETTVMIGDRLDTDIAFGKQNGLETILTLTGVSNRDDISLARNMSRDWLIPDFVVDSVANFL